MSLGGARGARARLAIVGVVALLASALGCSSPTVSTIDAAMRVRRTRCTSDEGCPANALCEGGLCRRAYDAAANGRLCAYACIEAAPTCAEGCADGTSCVGGECIAGCYPGALCDTGCGAEGVCSTSVRACVPRADDTACGGCDVGTVCADLCRARTSVSDPCASVTCAEGEHCVSGRCASNPCAGVTCAEGESCSNGDCVATCRCSSECGSTEHCEGDRCVCTPRCAPGATCGSSDACGGTCFGTCEDSRCEATRPSPRPGSSTPVPGYECVCVTTCTESSRCGDDDGCGGRCPGACEAGEACVSSGFSTSPSGRVSPLFACQCLGCSASIPCGETRMLSCERPCVGSYCEGSLFCRDGACVCPETCESRAAMTQCTDRVGFVCGQECVGMGTQCPSPSTMDCGRALEDVCPGLTCWGSGTRCTGPDESCLDDRCCTCPRPASVACGVEILATGACAGTTCGTTGTNCDVGDCIDGRCIETCPSFLACGATTTLSDGTICAGTACPVGETCVDGACGGAPCSSPCPAGEFCANGGCYPIECDRPLCGGVCCPSDLTCDRDRCRPLG
ncbi:MAG: hypothetical protein J0L92_05110 [Deltaproteobacteria bacterium]|nr:hypothetical protein [Deltaproteobacteria bacterium]